MPDFGIMRGFNEKLFGDKLVAGQLPTQLGLIGSSDFGFDPDAQAFFDRVTAAGGTLSVTEKTAVDTLVKQMKLDGIWSLMKAIYPMVGASAAACAQNLKSSSFTGTFTSGWTFASTGATPNGSSAFMNTNVNMLNDLSQNNSHISVYSRTDIANTGSMIGVYNGSFSNSVMLYPNLFGSAYINMFSSGGSNQIGSQTNSLGFRAVTRVNSSEINFFNLIAKTTLTITSITGTNNVLYIGANNSSGSAANHDTRQNAFTTIGDGLTDTQASNLYTAVQAFQTTLSRNV
jgi:hypothetical protein